MQAVDQISSWATASVLLALRIGPAFAFAPPFTLTRVPVQFRVLLALGLAACMIGSHPAAAAIGQPTTAGLLLIAMRELMLGGVVAMAFQIVFGALYFAGRSIDIQAGYGLAMLIDPTTKAQTPLVGTILAYAAGAIFFAMDGHGALLRLLAASLQTIPLGAWTPPETLDHLTRFIALAFLTGLGVTGGLMLALFLTDAAIALLSRTTPQMNVLMLGFQLKAIVLLVVLPLTLGVGGAVMTRMMVSLLEGLPGLMA
jgi:flagellar biosynthetic protein FliR